MLPKRFEDIPLDIVPIDQARLIKKNLERLKKIPPTGPDRVGTDLFEGIREGDKALDGVKINQQGKAKQSSLEVLITKRYKKWGIYL